MAYDPTKPANNSPVSSSELRSQFAGLKQITDTIPDADQIGDVVSQRITAQLSGITFTSPAVSDPPTQTEVQYISDVLENLIARLKEI